MTQAALAALARRGRASRAGRPLAEIRRLAEALGQARRQLKDNRAIHAIALVRMRGCPRIRAYVRRAGEGKTPREIRHCFKRYIGRELYQRLTRTMNPPEAP